MRRRSAFDRATLALGLLLLGLSVLLMLRLQVKLLDFLEWGDESETIVAAKMLAAGMSLYSQVFNHHGPLTFLPGVLLELMGSFGVREHRIVIVVLQVMALAAVYASPLLRDEPARCIKRIVLPIAMTAIVAFLPQEQLWGHTYIYQVLAGLLLMVLLAQYTLPALIDADALRPTGVLLANVGIISLPFLAITYLPPATLLFLCSLRLQYLRAACLGIFVGLTLNLVFLACIGSFSGYLADHIYLNSKILPAYSGVGLVKIAKLIRFSLSSGIEMWFASVGLTCALSWLVLSENSRLPWRTVALAISICSLLIRGLENHGATFWYCCIAVVTVLLARVRFTRSQTILWLCFAGLCVLCLASPSTIDFQRGRRPETTEFGRLARQLTAPTDKIIAYSFQNFEYLAADRLPASGNFFYLPWQEKYNENPQYGIFIDACRDIHDYKPKLMLIDKWVVWGRYSWESYGGCIQNILDHDYQKLPGQPIYVRSDMFELALQLQRNSKSAKP